MVHKSGSIFSRHPSPNPLCIMRGRGAKFAPVCTQWRCHRSPCAFYDRTFHPDNNRVRLTPNLAGFRIVNSSQVSKFVAACRLLLAMFFMQEILRIHPPQPTAFQPLQYICAAAAAEYAGLETHELKHCSFGIWVKAHLLCVSQSSPFFGSSAAAASSDCPFKCLCRWRNLPLQCLSCLLRRHGDS